MRRALRLLQQPRTCTCTCVGARTMAVFIQTESTPNPHALKFLPGRVVLPEEFGTGMFFQAADQRSRDLQRSPLAKQLLRLQGVKGVFLGRDFVTVTKETNFAWVVMKTEVFGKLTEFFAEGSAVVSTDPVESDTKINDDDTEIVAMIKELIESRVRPSVQEDGGDIFYISFDEDTGIVKVRLAGSCVGCPSSTITLKNGVENMLKHYIPEVAGVEEAEDDLSTLNNKDAEELAEPSKELKI